MKDLFSVQGKRVLVTGGSRGIGLMIARGFVANGAKVTISSRKADVCEQVAAELSKHGTCAALPTARPYKFTRHPSGAVWGTTRRPPFQSRAAWGQVPGAA